MWRIETWKQKARELRTETYALYLAVKDPRVPWYAKFSAVCVVAYALSPIDLIPDFIPVLGYVDDLILIPLGIALTIKMIPPDVLAECKANAHLKVPQSKFLGWIGAILVLALWVVIIFAVVLRFSQPEKQVSTQNELLQPASVVGERFYWTAVRVYLFRDCPFHGSSDALYIFPHATNRCASFRG